MSLKVWLPLNGNLDNLAGANLNFSTANVTDSDSGKIGKCKTFAAGYAVAPYDFTLTDQFSAAVWIKYSAFPSTSSNDWILHLGSTSGFANAAFVLATYHQNYLTIGFAGKNTAEQFAHGFSLNQWYHVAVTWDGSIASIYINGELKKTWNNLTGGTKLTGDKLSLGSNVILSSTRFNGDLNDVRIYDHCLSALEVKEISQGLVLHYKLDRFDGNLLKQIPKTYNSTAYNAYQLNLTENLIEGETYTIQLWDVNVYHSAKTAAQTGVSLYWGGGNIRLFHLIGTTYFTQTSSENYHADYLQQTITITSSQASGSGATNAWLNVYNSPANATGTKSMSIGHWKLEKGSVATSWSPTLEEMGKDSSQVIDSSGYRNNGIQNNIIIEPDSMRYLSSAKFNGSNSYIKVKDNNWLSDGMEALTINLWGKASNWNAAKIFSCTETGGFNTESGNSGYLRFPIYVFTNAEKTSKAYKYDSKEIQISALSTTDWNMITWVYDLTGTKTYINGKLHHTYTNTSYGISFNTRARLFLGCEANTADPSSPYFNGQISDFRIYTTALSAEDVLTLYNTPAQIDKLSSIHGFELVENGEKQSINKKGQIINNSSSKTYLINNFAETNTMDDWTFGGSPTISNGVVTMTGINPSVSSNNFTVNPDDIIVIEFGIEMPVISTGTSGPGIYLGTPTGSANSATRYQYNFTTRTWTTANANDTNPYFIYAYNSTDYYHCRTYLLGSNKTIDDLPPAEASNSSRTLYALKLNSATTSKIRSGYNTNTTMTIKLNDFKIYKLDNEGFCEGKDTAKVGVGYYQTKNFIEK